MTTVIDFSSAFPSGRAIKQNGHQGAVLYVSPPREAWMKGKNPSRQVLDDYDKNNVKFAFVWQYGAGSGGMTTSDVRRGYHGGVEDAKKAKKRLEELQCAGHPVFFAVDFNASLQQWNSVIVEYFKGAVSVLGKQRVGIYGHSRVVHWAMEDDVVATVAPGRVLGWITKAWSNGETGQDYGVLYQKIHNTGGPDGVQIDINNVFHPEWGWRALPGRSTKITPQSKAVNSSPLVYPMKNGTYTRTSGYGERWGTFHAGIDLAAPIGTPIYAAADGYVVEGKERAQGSVGGFGSWIWLDCQQSVGKDFIYGHVHHPGILVKAGDKVRAGQQIGVVGNEGESTGAHLHFEVWSSPGRVGGKHQNPDPYMHGSRQPGEPRKIEQPKPSATNAGGSSMGITLNGLRPNPNHRGDPVWLPRVLKAFGVRVQEYGAWTQIGHGDFGVIKGVVAHHTGTNKDIPGYIQNHPDLGLCSQIHLSRDGVAQIVGAGIAWHAGLGSYPGWPKNNANAVSIGIEAASDGKAPWSNKQLDAYYRTVAGILWYLGKNATTDNIIAHWEYSRAAQGKWDPGAGVGRSGVVMDMNHFRREVQKYIDAARRVEKGLIEDDLEDEMSQQKLDKILTKLDAIDDRVSKIEIQIQGPTQEQRKSWGWTTNPQGGRGWEQLGTNKQGQWLTLVDAVSTIRRDVDELKKGAA